MLVGEYVHYRYKNYRDNGLARKDGSEVKSISKIFDEQRSLILKNLLMARDREQKIAIKTSLEQQLNFFFNPADAKILQAGYTAEEAQQIQNKIIALCQEALGKISDNAQINWKNLSITDIGNINLDDDLYKEFQKIRETRLGEGKSATTKQAVSRRLKALMDLRDSLNNQMISGAVDWDFVTKLDKFEKEYRTIISPLIEAKDGTNVQTSEGSTRQKFSVVKNEAFIRDLQELIDDTKKITLQQVNGILGEYIPVLTQAVFQNVAEKGLQETLKDFKYSPELMIPVMGKARSHKGIVSTNVIVKKGTPKTLQTEALIGDIPAKVGNTYDKVDIQLTIPNGELINASVKNVRASAPSITLLNGKSILQYFQDYPEFTNHYLNITASHPARGDSKPMASTIQLAHDTAKLTIAFHALTGYTQGKAQGSDTFAKTPMAEILIINSRKKESGHFKVIFMSDIINKVANDLNLLNIENFNQPKIWDNIYIGSKPNVRMAYARIANILGQLHNYQLRVSLKKKAFS